jgi:hypothetical protein
MFLAVLLFPLFCLFLALLLVFAFPVFSSWRAKRHRLTLTLFLFTIAAFGLIIGLAFGLVLAFALRTVLGIALGVALALSSVMYLDA